MKQAVQKKLVVEGSIKGDVYKDVVRIHWRERGANKIGAIVAISVDSGPLHFFSIRGLSDEDEGKIRFDFVALSELKLKAGDSHDFAIRVATPLEKLRWALRATDPAARIATWIAVWSGIFGILGLALAAIGTVPVIKEWVKPEKPLYSTSIY